MTSFPGFRLPDELLMLRDQIRRFVREEIIPLEQQLDPDAPDIPADDFQRLSAKTKAAGLWALAAPEEYGGGGLDTFSMCVLLEEIAQHRMGLYNPGCGVFGRYPPPAIWAGTKEQIKRYAVPAIREGWETFWAITEPSGGSDPAGAIRTRAEKRGDQWVLNGRKVFISRAHDAPWGVVFARTDAARGRAGISCFIVERGTPGFTARPIRTIRTASIPNDVVFEDCAIPAENLIGAEGQGLDLAFDLLVKQRFPYSACNLGVAVAAHRMAVAHARQRVTFGQPLSQRQAIQWMLADAEVELRAARWLIWDGAWKADRGEDARVEASIAKLYSSEVLGRVVDAAVQIHGGYGVSKEFPLERWYREARVRRIGEGPSEVHRMVIARSLLRG
jgi:acyl-CoA dehydrogenase